MTAKATDSQSDLLEEIERRSHQQLSLVGNDDGTAAAVGKQQKLEPADSSAPGRVKRRRAFTRNRHKRAWEMIAAGKLIRDEALTCFEAFDPSTENEVFGLVRRALRARRPLEETSKILSEMRQGDFVDYRRNDFVTARISQQRAYRRDRKAALAQPENESPRIVKRDPLDELAPSERQISRAYAELHGITMKPEERDRARREAYREFMTLFNSVEVPPEIKKTFEVRVDDVPEYFVVDLCSGYQIITLSADCEESGSPVFLETWVREIPRMAGAVLQTALRGLLVESKEGPGLFGMTLPEMEELQNACA